MPRLRLRTRMAEAGPRTPVPLVLVPNLMTRARPPVTIDQRRGNCCFKFSAGSDMPI